MRLLENFMPEIRFACFAMNFECEVWRDRVERKSMEDAFTAPA